MYFLFFKLKNVIKKQNHYQNILIMVNKIYIVTFQCFSFVFSSSEKVLIYMHCPIIW